MMLQRISTRVLTSIVFATLSIALGVPLFTHASPSITNDIYINSSADTSPCGSGTWTLRCAINFANGDANPTNILFSVYTVVLSDSLPAITHAGTWIDGTTVKPLIDGSNLPFSLFTGHDIFTIAADNVTLSNLQIINGAFRGNAITISSGKNIAIAYNDIGIETGSSTCPGLSGGDDGVYMAHNTAGTSAVNVAYIYGNTISCNGGAGVDIRDATVSVGLDRTGSAIRNYIGTTDNGQHAAGNGNQGVYVSKSFSTWVTDTIANNTISGNTEYGIFLRGNGTDNAIICNNTIGLNYYTNTAPLAVPNHFGGIFISGAANTQLGSCQSFIAQQLIKNNPSGLIILGSGNVIAGNIGPGMLINNAVNTTVSGDQIGGDPLAVLAGFSQYCLGNTQQGILVEGDTYNSSIYPGSVACNGGAGVATTGLAISQTNTLVPSFVAYNQGLPIDRANNGVTPLNYPTIDLVSTSTITPVISGSACNSCQVKLYAAIGNPGTKGGGGRKIGSTTASGFDGHWAIAASPSITNFVPALVPASFTAYVIDTAGSTYEMRPRPQIFLPLMLKLH